MHRKNPLHTIMVHNAAMNTFMMKIHSCIHMDTLMTRIHSCMFTIIFMTKMSTHIHTTTTRTMNTTTRMPTPVTPRS